MLKQKIREIGDSLQHHILRINDIWDVMPCNPIGSYQTTYFLQLEGRKSVE
jgi:hypothetical protein